MMNRRNFLEVGAATLALLGLDPRLLSPAAAADAPDAGSYFFRDGDRVVMIGDSITEQHLHSNYVEIFALCRNPAWNLTFRNAGIGGDTSAGGNRRAARDILAFHPTAVTITFGMNDAGYKYPPDPARVTAYEAGLQGLMDQLKPAGIRVAVLSSSPVEKKEDGPALEGYNQTLEQFAAIAQKVAERNGARFVDQFHPHVATLQKARDADPAKRVNGGDAVHPGPAGQLLMAWAILKGLGAGRTVSAVELDWKTNKARHLAGCKVTEVRWQGKGLRFLRADQALPLWIPPAARSILPLAPIVEDLNQYTLRVNDLREGRYDLKVDGVKCATYTAAELHVGVNLALLTEGPVAKQSQAVFDAVFAKNRYYHDQIFRGVVLNKEVADADKPAQVEERMKGMLALEQAIRDALVLKPRLWELEPASQSS